MSKAVIKGRPKGTTKSTFIKDPLLEPYHIVVDENSFSLVLFNEDTKKEKVLGYFTKLEQAVLKASKLQLVVDKSYTLNEWQNTYFTKLEQLEKAILYGNN